MGEQLRLEVQDDGPGLPAAPAAPQAGRAGRGVGLANARLRLQQAFGARASLTLRDAEGGGCLARVCVPFQQVEQSQKEIA